jgi:hypothetical protein
VVRRTFFAAQNGAVSASNSATVIIIIIIIIIILIIIWVIRATAPYNCRRIAASIIVNAQQLILFCVIVMTCVVVAVAVWRVGIMVIHHSIDRRQAIVLAIPDKRVSIAAVSSQSVPVECVAVLIGVGDRCGVIRE